MEATAEEGSISGRWRYWSRIISLIGCSLLKNMSAQNKTGHSSSTISAAIYSYGHNWSSIIETSDDSWRDGRGFISQNSQA